MAKKKKAKTKKKTIKRKPTKRTGGGSKLARTEIVQVRLDPKLRFAAELSSRRQRRTLSSFIEWAIDEAVSKTELVHKNRETGRMKDVLEIIWHVEEADRFILLALNFPDLLTHEEEVLWNLIRANSFRWLSPDSMELEGEKWLNKINELDFIRFRAVWDDFKKVVQGEIEENDLPILKYTPDPFPEDFLPKRKEK